MGERDLADSTETSERSRCPICGQSRVPIFDATVLDLHSATYEWCEACGLLQIPAPSWLEEAYDEPIASLDTGILARTMHVGAVVDALLTYVLRPAGPILDHAAGYGLLVRYLRDRGWDCWWEDPFAPNLTARGFEAAPHQQFEVALAVEVLEHLEDPLRFLRDLRSRSGCRAIVFTTVLLPERVPDPHEWWYYSLETGQHISFLQRRTLEQIASRMDWHLFTSSNVHVIADRPVPPWTRLVTSRFAPLVAPLRRRRTLTESDRDLVKASRKESNGR